MFGILPAYGFFIRHAKGIELNDVDVSFVKEDRRPAFVLDSVEGIELEHCKAERADGVPGLVMIKAKGIKIHATEGIVDFHGDSPGKKEM
jgi:hypothetical protein